MPHHVPVQGPKRQTVGHGILHDMMLTILHLCPRLIEVFASMAFDFLGFGFACPKEPQGISKSQMLATRIKLLQNLSRCSVH